MEEKNKDLITLIQINFSRLSKGQRLIAEYILNHYDKAAFMTASKLGEMVGVSESTVVRFANALGFAGYPSLQRALQELIKNKLTTVQRLSMSNNYSDNSNLLKKILKADMDNIRSTIEEISNDEFEKVVDCIYNANRVYIIGLRSSTTLANYLGFYLSLILDNVKVVTYGISDIFEQLLRVNKGDVVIGISYPRYSRRTLEALNYVKQQECKIIGITDSFLSPISGIADYTLIAKSNMISFVDSLVAPLSLINALIIAIGMKEKNEIAEYFQKLETLWSEYNVYDCKDKKDLF
ncbi:transcriptional regulator, RpiR family [Caloranaerobacter azorensis DSM 13643]|uniref:Transcriptional regulator, RpiR family n=1 Tax=Caloranaerobacter azorensis DSM 13643 TaxID=1121264 RepID=A0A1M5TAL0_9FIRM|nr:MurR/RpiR family transcriptional regulator [Caloranaerobacter azorensis]SHH47762.1 transcriptional regulator, RpiR family [Caloranaerobacter azorensis DSM 13643]